MFFHSFKYRLKCILRNRELIFWTFLFPLALATLFNLALTNIKKFEAFSPIEIGLIESAELTENTPFKKAIDGASWSGDIGSDEKIFISRYLNRAEGERLLETNEISGYIYYDNGLRLMVGGTGLDQTIIKSFVDGFSQTQSMAERIIKENPESINEGLLENLGKGGDFLKELPPGRAEPNVVVNYFYVLIAMTCFYGGFLGLNEVTTIQADLSPQAARINVAPTHKFKAFITFLLAAFSIQLIEMILLMVYLIFVLNIDFGNQLAYVILACIVGSLAGITFGSFIASIVKGGVSMKIGILIGASMTMSFLSGMMYDKMKYIVNTKIPILGYLNPINLITDSFYSLYYYDTHSRFFVDIIILCGMTLIFGLGTYLVIRRQKYASI